MEFSQEQKTYAEIVQKAWDDADFKKELTANPVSAIEKLTGKKMTEKVYTRHTGHPGGQRFATPRELMAKDGRRVVEMAIKGMLPKNRLGSKLYTNLYVYEGAEHPHQAQLPTTIEINN